MNEPTLPIQEIAALLWRRRYLIATVFPIGLVTVIVMAWLQPPTYRAAAKLMVTSARATMTVSPDANERPRVDPVSASDLSAAVNMLSSASLVREVLEPHSDQLEMAQAPTLLRRVRQLLSYPFSLPGRVYRRIHDLPPPSPMDEWVEAVSRNLAVAQVGLSTLIEVTYEDRHPEWAAELVNSLVSHHVERHIRMNREASAQQFYESQRELLSGKLRDAEASLRSFYDREGIAATASGLPALRERVAQLEAALDDSQAELAESSAEAEFLGRAMSNLPAAGAAPAAALSGPALIKNHVVELELQRSQLLAQYAPTSMKISDLDRQIAEARRLLEDEKRGAPATGDPTRQSLESSLTKTQARTAALQARSEALRQQLESTRTQMAHVDSIGSEQDRLEQEVLTAKESLATYLKKEEEARFSNALDESRIVNVTIVDRAPVPSVPLESKRTMTILLGAVVSLAAGLGLAFVRDVLDPSVKSGTEARRISGLPILAEIPS
jgi:polysaccharide biosynthesis transport protein